jgi:hypothetical protein
MNLRELQQALEMLATRVVRIDKAFAEELKLGQVPDVEFKEPRVTWVRRVTPQEYYRVKDMEEESIHEMCVALFRDAVRDMPANDCVLYWRVEPEYETQVEYSTGCKYHKVYFRLGWMEEW